MATTNIHAEALAEAEAEIQKLEGEFHELKSRMTEAQAVANWHRSRLGSPGPSSVAPPVQHITPETKPLSLTPEDQQHSGEFATTRQIDAAAKVLADSDRPLKTAEIVQAMIAGGFAQQDAKKLSASLFTSLLRKPDTFEKAGSGLWKLKNMKT